MTNPIHARLIIEMLGKPKEHVEKTIAAFLEKFEEKFEFVKKEIAEATAGEGDLFSSFAEVEIKFKTPQELFGFCLDAMPSSVEIIEPSEIKFDRTQFSDYLNDVQGKLHEVDMLVKALSAQNKTMDRNSTNIFYNFLLYLLSEKPRTLAELSPYVGIKTDGLKPFLDQLIEKKRVTLDGNKYKTI